MEISSLKIFREVAVEGSFTKAAEKLHYVQSNVTMRIQLLERELGDRLFQRTKAGVTLTPKGKILLEYAEKILFFSDEARKALSSSGDPQGVLRIGSGETTSSIRLPSYIAKFHSKFPKVKLSIHPGNTGDLLQGLIKRELDGAFLYEDFSHPTTVSRPIFTENLKVVTPKNFKTIRALTSSLDNLSILVFKPGCIFRNRLEQWLISQKIGPRSVVELNSMDSILSCVMAGMGISLLPESILKSRKLDRFISSFPIPKEFSQVRTFFVFRKDVSPTTALGEFRDGLFSTVS
ncbi:LysR family transcriptional regulator [Leptospira kmetyi]|uniref:LysR family transcriptional regulator n=1 Tax=Leptospira kmetyi TaxID=408139 RepID=UPI003EBBFF01